jgi:AraC family transcriptional regulator
VKNQQMNKNDYIMRINLAINYIHDNIDKNLTVEDISKECCFSKYYFNRIFKSIVHESIYSFIKRLKLEAAAFKLRTNQPMSITDIALDIGYSPSNFATAFKEYFGMSASDYRRNNKVPVKNSYLFVLQYISNLKKQDNFFQQIDSKITIKKLPEMTLEYQRFIGNYCDLKDAWHDFCIEVNSKYCLNENNKYMGISYDDPLITDENRCIYDMCVRIDNIKGTNVHKIKEGLYACYEFYDKVENLINGYNELFSLWVPFSKYSIINKPPVEIYHCPQDDEGKMKVDLCLPIK